MIGIGFKWIPYTRAEPGEVTLRIYNVAGQLVREIGLGHREAGFDLGKERAGHWNGRNATGERVSSGIYFYQMLTPHFQQTRRLVILK